MMFRLAAMALLLLAAISPAQAQQGFSAEQRAAIVEILREALRSDPTILEDAIGALQARDAARDRDATRGAIAANAAALLRDPTDPAKGAARPTATIVEFFDYRCPYCKRMNPVISDLVRADPGLRVVLKDMPILGPASVVAARAALAAQRQGKYVAMHDALMRFGGNPDEAAIMRIAAELGLDATRLRRDMAEPAIAQKLDANIRLAQALGIQGTPAYVVGNVLLPGAVGAEELREAIARARAAPQ